MPPGRPPREQVYVRLHAQIDEMWTRLGGLPSPVEAADIWRGIWLEEAHHSTAIEGNTLGLKQVEALLADGRAVGDKELREYMEVRGYANAAEWVYGRPSTGGMVRRGPSVRDRGSQRARDGDDAGLGRRAPSKRDAPGGTRVISTP